MLSLKDNETESIVFRKYPVAIILALTIGQGHSQLTLHSGTNMWIANGTTVTIPDGHSFELESNSNVENNGILTFLGTASLSEPAGFPIHGTGTETSLSFQSAALSFSQPGGLGLALDQESPIDSLKIIRGHTPRINDQGQHGVNRWYEVIADKWGSTGSLYFFIDDTELNGLATSQLTLHQSNTGVNWAYIPGTLDPNNLLAGYPIDSLGIFTLFADSLVSGIEATPEALKLMVYPNPANELVVVSGFKKGMNIQVYNTNGKLVVLEHSMRSETAIALSVSSLTNGLYLIRVGNEHTLRFLKQ